MNTPAAVRIERSNFEGSWSDVCPHCGKVQIEHRVTHGPYDGVLYEHRMPCRPEQEKIRGAQRRTVVTIRVIILIGWMLVPFLYLLLQQFVAIVGWIAFGIGILQLCVVTIKLFGDPDRWIPGHKKKKTEELRNAHYIYHCEQNPDAFARLRAENFEREENQRHAQKSSANKKSVE